MTSWFERVIWLLLLFIGFLIGGMVQRRIDFIDGTNKEIITSEIHLKIPKDKNDLRKELLHVTAQKAILEQLDKWWKLEKK